MKLFTTSRNTLLIYGKMQSYWINLYVLGCIELWPENNNGISQWTINCDMEERSLPSFKEIEL